jgi:hypothetical protein
MYVKVWFNLHKLVSEVCETLSERTFCGDARSRKQTFEWYSRFISGQHLVDILEFLVDHRQVRLAKIWKKVKVIHEDRWHKINDVCNILGPSHKRRWRILTEDLNTNLYLYCRMTTTNKTDFICVRICKITPKRAPTPSSEFVLFSKIKIQLQRRSFDDIAEN